MDNPQVAKLIAQLKQTNWEVRRSAADVLGNLGDAAAVSAIIKALKDENRYRDANGYVRHSASEALVKIGIPAVPALITALKDEDHDVRWHVAYVLGQIGDASAVPALIEALKDVKYVVGFYAAAALGSIGDASAVPALIAALQDAYSAVRTGAATALRSFGDSDTLPRKIRQL